MRRPALAALTTLLALSAGCTADLEFADWVYPPPEGTPIKEYGPVALDARDADTVRLVDDLILGEDLTDPEAVLYQPTSVVASEDGMIFVGDRGANNVKMFGPDGAYRKSLGKEGQGPAEFGSVGTLAIAGDHLVVNDSRNRRFSVWTLDGEHVADHAPANRVTMSLMQGLADGTLVGYFTDRDENRVGRRIVTRRTAEGEEIAQLFESPPLPPPTPVSTRDPKALLQDALESLDDPRVYFTVGAAEIIYVSPMTEYELAAISPDGDSLWALRVAWPHQPWGDAQKQQLVDSFLRNFPPDEPLTQEDLTWPEHTNSVVGILTDGDGRVFVFPSQPPSEDPERPPDEWPVDVYSPAGDFVAAGVVPYRWAYARGDYVYGTRPNDYDETVVVRYRLAVNQR